MRRAGWGWRGRLQLALAGCGRLAAAGLPARAQTEIEKSRAAALPPAAERSQEGSSDDSAGSRPRSRPRPVWSAEVTDRAAVAATAAEISGDEARTRFSLVFSAARPYQYFTLADPYRLIIDMPRRELRPAQRLGPAGPRPDPSLPLRPVRTRQVAHRHRYQRAGADRAGGHGQPSRRAAARLNIDLVPTDRASFVTKLPPPASRPKETRRPDQDDLPRRKAARQARHRHRCRAWRGRSRSGQRRGAGEGRGARGCPASAHRSWR